MTHGTNKVTFFLLKGYQNCCYFNIIDITSRLNNLNAQASTVWRGACTVPRPCADQDIGLSIKLLHARLF